GVPALCLDHKAYPTREAFDEAAIAALREAGVEWVALAGFMRVLTPRFLEAFEGRIVNIHPSLLPAFPGVNSQRQAFDHGVKVAGCALQLGEGGGETGAIIAQRAVPVLEDDDAESLRQRILEQEHVIFVEALQAIAEGRVTLTTTPTGRSKVRIAP